MAVTLGWTVMAAIRQRALQCLAACYLGIVAAGCQQKMSNQPSFRAYTSCEFFPDHRSARPGVPGTVARGHLRTNTALFTGRLTNLSKNGGGENQSGKSSDRGASLDNREQFVETFPMPIDKPFVEHGQHRYII